MSSFNKHSWQDFDNPKTSIPLTTACISRQRWMWTLISLENRRRSPEFLQRSRATWTVANLFQRYSASLHKSPRSPIVWRLMMIKKSGEKTPLGMEKALLWGRWTTFQQDRIDAIWTANELLSHAWHRWAHQTVRGSNERAIENNHFAASPGDSLREPTTPVSYTHLTLPTKRIV